LELRGSNTSAPGFKELLQVAGSCCCFIRTVTTRAALNNAQVMDRAHAAIVRIHEEPHLLYMGAYSERLQGLAPAAEARAKPAGATQSALVRLPVLRVIRFAPQVVIDPLVRGLSTRSPPKQ
jgi:hypothetical protein